MKAYERIQSLTSVILLAFALGVMAASPLRAETQPKILGIPLVQIDPSSGAGRTLVYFFNDSTKTLPVLLTAGDLTLSGTTQALDAQIQFADEKDKTGGGPAYRFSIQPGEAAKAQALVTNVWVAGQSEADLQNKSVRIGKLKVSFFDVNVKVEGSATGKMDLPLVDGVPTTLTLKNEDPVSYPVVYRLTVDGKQVAENNVTLAPSGRALLHFVPSMPFEPSLQWLLQRFQNLFKAETHEGSILYLYLRHGEKPVDYSSPIKALPVKAMLNYFTPETREGLSYIVIVFFLILGGLCSLILSHALPNRLRKLNSLERLTSVARTTANLGTHVNSRLAVQVRVERSRLFDMLNSRTTIMPDFANLITQCDQAIDKLASRVGMLQQIDLVMEQLEKLAPTGVPPTQVDEIAANLDRATVFLGKTNPTDVDLQTAQSAIASAATGVEAINQPNPHFGQELAKRALDLKKDITANIAALPTFIRVNGKFPGPYKTLTGILAKTSTIDPTRYTSVDMAVCKVLLIREYVLLVEGTTEEIRRCLMSREADLMNYLQLQTMESIRSARLLIREMKENVYPEQLQGALSADPGQASIEMDPPLAYEGEPREFHVQFYSDVLNKAAAREEWTAQWDFGDGLKERAWTVLHYYLLPGRRPFRRRKPALFQVRATFHNADGDQVVDANGDPVLLKRDITVKPTKLTNLLGERSITEGIRLSAALLIAVFGLVAGAREQLLKLDVLPGLIAVFLVGFGADTIKNLLTSK